MRNVQLLLRQHVGAPCRAVVSAGDQVKKGTLIAEPAGLGANIFSSVYGTVAEVTDDRIIIEPSDDQPDAFEPIPVPEDAGILPLQYENKGAVTAREDFFGRLRCVVVARDAADFPAIREEVARRYEAVNRRIAPFDMNVDPHSQPYTVAQAATVAGTNGDPDDDSLWWVKYMVLLLVPAINLSSMTSSLLRRRRMEIGVRRAFGATRGRLASGILMENLVVTVAGTLVGLAASWLFVWLGIEYFVSSSSFERTFVPVSVSPTVLFSWATFSIAGVCALALNLLSSGLPSWNAARRNPVEALSGHEK